MTPAERATWYLLTSARALLSLFDLFGILAIGFVVTSTASFLTQGSSPGRLLEFAGLQLPAVTAQTLPIVAGAILATFLLKAVLSVLITRTTAYFVATVEARAAKAIANSVFGGDLDRARQRSREEVSYAIQFGSPAAFNNLLNFTSTVIAEGFLFLLICVGFLLIDIWATLAAVAYFSIIALVLQYFVGTLMAKAGAIAAKKTIEANNAVGDLISVFRELSVLRLRHKYIDRIYSSRVSAAESAATQTYLTGMPRYIVEAALLIGVTAFIIAQVLTGDIVSASTVVGVFLSGGFRLTAAMLPLQSAILNIKGHLPVAASAHEILSDTQLEIRISEARSPIQEKLNPSPTPTPVSIELRDVSFSYAGSKAPALHHISLTIAPGQQVAFIGPSGAGKSTIADVICGVLTPSAGSVRVFAIDEGPGLDPFGSVSYVPQKPGLVSGTVGENVALGLDAKETDEIKVWSAIKSAHLTDVVNSLPNGIHTNLGKYQDSLSGGQTQRLGLARALYSEPSLLVMDEATSALDAESESEIAKALEQMRGKVTVVLIAHRLNTVQHADKVFLIDHGQLVDEGTFQELVQRNAAVEKLVALMKVDENY